MTGKMAAPSRFLFGPRTTFGLVVVAIVCLADQASKLWLLDVFRLGDRGVVQIAPFFDLVLTWNKGISYGWFQQEGPFGQGALLAFKVLAIALLWIWLARSSSRLAALSLGLIIGGAIGNAVDRLIHGAVLDRSMVPNATVFGGHFLAPLAEIQMGDRRCLG